jgi:hypothetical protein
VKALAYSRRGPGSHIDYVAVHFYDVSFQLFQTYLQLWHNTFNLPILDTKFADQVCVATPHEAAKMLTPCPRIIMAAHRQPRTRYGRSGASLSSTWSHSHGSLPTVVLVGTLSLRLTLCRKSTNLMASTATLSP